MQAPNYLKERTEARLKTQYENAEENARKARRNIKNHQNKLQDALARMKTTDPEGDCRDG